MVTTCISSHGNVFGFVLKGRLTGVRLMKPILICLVAALALLAGYLVYRSFSSPHRLDVDPHAAHEIDKAKRR
jgi:hypothetical protein